LADRKDPLIADLQAAPPLSSADAEEACRWVLGQVPAADASLASTVDIVPSPTGPPRASDEQSHPPVPVSPPPPEAPHGKRIEIRVASPEGVPVGDLQTVLRRRLRFAATVFASIYAVYLVKVAMFYVGHPDPFEKYPAFFIVCATFPSEALAAWLLWSNKRLSLRHLRIIELAVVGLPVFNQSWLECKRLFLDHQLLILVEKGTEPLAALASGRVHVLPWFAIIMGYGALIPNTWRRCSGVVSTIAGVAFAVNFLAAVRDGIAFHSAVLHHLMEVSLWLGVAVAFAIYNSYRIDVYRAAAEEARKLGQYRLLHLLARSGMGEVYLAEHALLQRPCAIKLIRPERADDPDLIRRFRQEAQKTAALTHPNTIVIYDYGQADDGRFYYAMEYLPGLDLKTLVEGRERRPQPLPPGRVVFLLRQVCEALGEAHAVGLIHRDIKPSNVIACVRGGRHDVAKLLDFGLVRIQAPAPGGQPQTEEGKIAGTPDYMSPEQAAGGACLDRRSDLYSLGATAYFLLTGRPPFVRKTAVQTLAAHLEDIPDPPHRHCPGLPADLQTVVLRCLEKDPERRFQSAEELEEALAGCACAAQWDRAKAAAWWRQHGTA
jgi:serine/threonine-protein kinase